MLKFLVGIAAILVGLWLVLFVLGLATMVDPQLQGREWWSEVLMQYRRHREAWQVTALGLILVAGGMKICIGIRRQTSRT